MADTPGIAANRLIEKRVHQLTEGDVLSGSGFVVAGIVRTPGYPRKVRVFGHYPNGKDQEYIWNHDTTVRILDKSD